MSQAALLVMSACSEVGGLPIHILKYRSLVTTASTPDEPGGTTCRDKVGADAKWATIGVVTEQGTKQSAKGRAYGIWRLSDLQGTNVSLFLSGKAQAGLLKETEGSVVAVFNAEVLGWVFFTLCT